MTAKVIPSVLGYGTDSGTVYEGLQYSSRLTVFVNDIFLPALSLRPALDKTVEGALCD
jgi:hypothetical protein